MNMNFQLNFVSTPTPSSTPTPLTGPPTPTTVTTSSLGVLPMPSPPNPTPTSTTPPSPPRPTHSSMSPSCVSPSSLLSCSSSTPLTTSTPSLSTNLLTTSCTTVASTTITTSNSLLSANNINNMAIKTCAACRKPIRDQYFSVFDERLWHSNCLNCVICGMNLESSCFVRDGLTYCKQDYHKLFTRSCAKCHQIIEPHQLVLKVDSGKLVFHSDCFTCAQCYCVLHKNDYYGLIEDKIYCADHFSLILSESLTINNNPNNPGGNSNNLNCNNINLTNHRGPSSLSSASPVSSLSSPSSSSLSINYHQQQSQQQQQQHLHPLTPHHHNHQHSQPLHLLQQNVLNSPNPISPISNHFHHLNHHNSNISLPTSTTNNNHLNHLHLDGNHIKSEPLFNSSNGQNLKSSTIVDPNGQIKQNRGRPRRKFKKEPHECNNNTNSINVNSDNLSHSIENQHQLTPSHLLHPIPPTSTSSTSSSSTSSSHNDVFHDHLHGLGCPVDSLPGNLHESRLGMTKSPSCLGLNGQSTNGNHNGGGGSSNGSSSSKSKRVRTSFKHNQLKTMKSYFSINQNPDAKDLKGLAAKTGLSKRVLQVWFQNARAKWRKTSKTSSSKDEFKLLESSVDLEDADNQSNNCDDNQSHPVHHPSQIQIPHPSCLSFSDQYNDEVGCE